MVHRLNRHGDGGGANNSSNNNNDVRESDAAAAGSGMQLRIGIRNAASAPAFTTAFAKLACFVSWNLD